MIPWKKALEKDVVLSAAKAVHCSGSDQYSKDYHYNRPKEFPLETSNSRQTNKNDYYADD
jgi:hypothetical protein